MTSETKSNDKQLSSKDIMSQIWIGTPTTPFTDDFTVKRQLGDAGQFGITYKCIRKKDNKSFAVKLLNKNRFYRIAIKYRDRYLKAMHNEIEILKTLNHDYIIKLESIYEDKSTLYIVMEECTGGELFQRIVKKGQYSESDAAYVIKQLLEALKYMHEVNNIVHCDLKPDNILFLNKEPKSPLKIIDFGMSKVLPRLKKLTHLVGTPYYTAPEIVTKDQGGYSHSADVWSVGVIMYVMVFGYPPFYVDPEVWGKRERKAIYEKIKRGFHPKVRNTDKHGFGPWFPSHIPVSSEAKDLLANLLKKKVENRYTAHEALNHPWIQNQGGSKNMKKTIIPRQMLTSLAKFSNTCQLKLVVIKLFRQQFIKMRPRHFKLLEELFQKMDKDNNGVISYHEFETAITSIPEVPLEKKHIEIMFRELNVSNNGIRFEDLLNAVVHDYLIACDERLYAAFNELDTKDEGIISTLQLKEKLKEIDPLGEYDKALQVIKEQSLDQNGLIDYSEFLRYLHPNFDETPVWIPELHKMTSMQVRNKVKTSKKNN